MNFFERLTEQTKTEQQNLLNNPLIVRCFHRELTTSDYTLFLRQAYHHVKNTVPLLMLCGAKLPECYRWLHEPIAHYIEEEIGHEQWILSDLDKCGVPKARVTNEQPLLSSDVFVSYIYDIIQRKNPIGFFGMVYVLESTSVLLASKAADNIQSALKLPKNAFSYLYSHGSLDQSHMAFFEDTINQIQDSEDQDFIILCTNHLFRLYGNILNEVNMHYQGLPLLLQENMA